MKQKGIGDKGGEEQKLLHGGWTDTGVRGHKERELERGKSDGQPDISPSTSKPVKCLKD